MPGTVPQSAGVPLVSGRPGACTVTSGFAMARGLFDFAPGVAVEPGTGMVASSVCWPATGVHASTTVAGSVAVPSVFLGVSTIAKAAAAKVMSPEALGVMVGADVDAVRTRSPVAGIGFGAAVRLFQLAFSDRPFCDTVVWS